jgi:hypothetical protein
MAQARIAGARAMPKGLRHGFGVNAFQSNAPPHLVQRWTAIYGDVFGPDERAFAERMWERPIDARRCARYCGTHQTFWTGTDAHQKAP